MSSAQMDRLARCLSVLHDHDHAGLVRLLEEENVDVVGAVGDGNGLEEATMRLRPDVIVTDLSMPGLGVFDMLDGMQADGLVSPS